MYIVQVLLRNATSDFCFSTIIIINEFKIFSLMCESAATYAHIAHASSLCMHFFFLWALKEVFFNPFMHIELLHALLYPAQKMEKKAARVGHASQQPEMPESANWFVFAFRLTFTSKRPVIRLRLSRVESKIHMEFHQDRE